MKTEKRDFDKAAASWDENPARVKLAEDVAHTISTQIVVTPDMNVLDFGCGTGLLTINLQPLVRSITGVDSSQGMLDVFNMKIAELKLDKISSRRIDLDRGDSLAGHYDLVVSNMTLHHIKEIKPLFDQFHRITTPHGYLCIADLDLEDGQFHDDNTGVFHFGFDRVALRKIFIEAGFDNVRDIAATEIVRHADNGEVKKFSVFLMTGQKRAVKSELNT